ncbi:hypothetical protein M3Y99_01837100 [Aphelenchoides fujianensis]|nr:hypothetical protein M3Y99_01837100 [Aphelenchoides fujianensis]
MNVDDPPANALEDAAENVAALNLEGENAEPMVVWPIVAVGDDDRVSFEDSERFEDDSISSWQSENESLDKKWSDWNVMPGPSTADLQTRPSQPTIPVPTLVELAAQKAASALSFDAIESMYHCIRKSQIPEPILRLILQRCFPSCPEDVRTYSFITNGSPNPFKEGKKLFEKDAVHEVMQIGYHISASVRVPEVFTHIKGVAYTQFPPQTLKVSIRVDRCRIVSCNCSCDAERSWCQHIVAVCMFRIYRPKDVEYRPTIWDSITGLSDEKLKKFAQYMLNELPREYLPVAQRLIDQLLCPTSEINQTSGAPDPTAGSADLATWCMDEKQLADSIRKILINFVKPSPTIHCDIAYLHATSNERQNSSSEFLWLQRIQQSHAPDPLWKLLEIVIHMLKRGDENATTLLHTITEHCLCVDQVLMWWYQTKLITTGYWFAGPNGAVQQFSPHSQTEMKRVAANTLCEEIVRLWRLAALNPRLSAFEREELSNVLRIYHERAVEGVCRSMKKPGIEPHLYDIEGVRLTTNTAPFSTQFFPGFFPALQACHFDWTNPLLSVTCQEVGAISFSAFIEARVAKRNQNEEFVVNLPILRQGAESLVEELYDTEHQITTTLNVEELIDQRYRSKRQARQKRKRRHVARHEAQLQVLNRTRANPPRRREGAINGEEPPAGDVPASDEDEAMMDEEQALEPGPSHRLPRQPPAAPANLRLARRHLWAANDRHLQEVQEVFEKANNPEVDDFQRLFDCCKAMVSYGWPGEARLLAERLALDMINHQLPSPSAPAPPNHSNEQPELPTASANFRPPSKRAANAHGQRGGNRKARGSAAAQRNEAFGYRRPPTRDQLTTTRKAVTMLQRTIFLLKTLVRSSAAQSTAAPTATPVQICPVTLRPTMTPPTAAEGTQGSPPAFYFPAHSNALRLAVRTLLAARGPAPTKQLEVQMFVLEQELYALLRHGIRPNAHDLNAIRAMAVDFLRRNAGAASELPRPNVPPLLFAHFVWEALAARKDGGKATSRRVLFEIVHFYARPTQQSDVDASAVCSLSDEELAMAVALCTLKMRVSFSERQYPMLFECMRRQRNEFTLQLLTKNTSSKDKLNVILDAFLDPQVHCIYGGAGTNAILSRACSHCRNASLPTSFCTCWRLHEAAIIKAATDLNAAGRSEPSARRAVFERMASTASSSAESNAHTKESSGKEGGSFERADSPPPTSSSNLSAAHDANDSGNAADDLQSIGSSRYSDSHSTKTSASTSKSSSLSGAPISSASSKSSAAGGIAVVEWPLQTHGRRPTATYGEVRIPPYALQYASDDLTNSLLEMAKKLVQDAGGAQQANYMNVVDAFNGGQVAMNRPLQMCAFVIGLYALGVNNIVDSSGWTARHYSMLVGWLLGQIIDIGPDAFQIVVETWEHHFSAGEVVALVEKAHQSMDDRLVPFTADLLLSAMFKADRMTKQDCQKALNLCRDSTIPILQKACETIEEVAKHDGISPEILFHVAEHWFELHNSAQPIERGRRRSRGGGHGLRASGLRTVRLCSRPCGCGRRTPCQPFYGAHPMQQAWEYGGIPTAAAAAPVRLQQPAVRPRDRPSSRPQMPRYPPMPASAGLNGPPHVYAPPPNGPPPAYPPAEPPHRLHASQSAPNLQPAMHAASLTRTPDGRQRVAR